MRDKLTCWRLFAYYIILPLSETSAASFFIQPLQRSFLQLVWKLRVSNAFAPFNNMCKQHIPSPYERLPHHAMLCITTVFQQNYAAGQYFIQIAMHHMEQWPTVLQISLWISTWLLLRMLKSTKAHPSEKSHLLLCLKTGCLKRPVQTSPALLLWVSWR